ncbi:AT-hook motif nuclear-localized protein 1 [Sesamum angolense]|uniref:AT-hook motif nuclear-localized protein n=1 Tax=Sesamum angolense TaxID=2727404 RepID=A0AAE2C6X0_9LAMI|nr:AT-hook motif nuclear-localized protein 1 [Sesamum angolense]
MDTGKAMASGVTVIAPGAPSTYHMAPRIENSELGTTQMSSPLMTSGSERKKRGRPRKYKPDESSSRTFSSVQVSSSAPLASGKAYAEEDKLNVARPMSSEKKLKSKIGTEKLDDWVDCSTGSSFLPHVITVNTGEDISTKIMEFSREGPRAVCIISGSGTVSTLTIRHPSSSGGITTYEGLFEILSFSGSFTPMEMPDPKFGTSGRMSITLSGADGRVVGGLIAGLTLAASPVKVVVASFLLGSPQELKPKKHFTVDALGPNGASASNAEKRSSDNVQGPGYSISDNPTNWAAMQNAERSRKSKADINISLQG